MNAITTQIKFELAAELNEIATIEQDFNGLWAFTTTKGYNGWEGDLFKSFNKCYNSLKKYEANSVKELEFENKNNNK